MSEEQLPKMPPANFEFLVFSLRTQAEMNMGLYSYAGEEEREEPDLDLARHAIDLLGVIEEKTRGNLSLEEDRVLNNSLAELRFHFVQASSSASANSAKEQRDQPIIVAPDGSNPSEDAPRIILP